MAPPIRPTWILAILTISSLSWGGDAVTVCRRDIPNCVGPYCEMSVECHHGLCGKDGQCECLPCFSGPSCRNYDDKYGPRFAIPEDTVIVPSTHKGVVYKATAEDEDLGLTCPLGPGLNTRCPCATVSYSLKGDLDHVFTIHESSGQVSLREGVQLSPGRHYQLQIIASNINVSEVGVPVKYLSARQTLTILVHSDDHLQDLLDQNPEALPVKTEDPDYDTSDMILREEEEEYKMALPREREENPPQMIEPQALQRRKRDAAGNTDDTGSTKLEFTRLTDPAPNPLKPGNSLDYELKIILPRLTTAMDLVVEVFVMDPVSGITPLAICNLDVTSVGSQIKDESGAPITDADARKKIEKIQNSQLTAFHDRVKINFGKVKNDAAFGGSNYDDSTITIRFSAIVIINPNYQNSTVLVTAGAEYSDQEYISVSTDSLSADLTAGSYQSSLTGLPSGLTAKQYRGVTFTVDAIVKHPFGDLLFEASSGDAWLDQFSVTQVGIIDGGMGSKWACMSSEFNSIKYYKSISGMTNHRAVFSAKLIMTNGQTVGVDSDYKIPFFVTIFVYDALVADKLTVKVGLVVDSSSVATEDIEITVEAKADIAEASPTIDTPVPMTSTEVEAPGAATWAIPINIPAGGNMNIDCTITKGAGEKVCGVVYGKVGPYIARLPDLSSAVTYSSGEATKIKMLINSTQATGGTDDKLNLEVTVQYSGAPSGTGTIINCGSDMPLIATSGTAGTTDMSGGAKTLPVANSSWYEGSQAGLTITLKFPDGGLPYDVVKVEGAGDLDLTNWGARLCRAWIERAGKAVPCVAGPMGSINDGVTAVKAKTASFFNDGFTMDLGPVCGTDRLVNGVDEDYEVVIKMVFDIPKSQSFTAVAFNMSAGISMGVGQDKIFTGWDYADTSTASPTYSGGANPKLAFRERNSGSPISVDPEVPNVIKVLMKTPPGSVGVYSLTASVDAVTNIAICRILILHVGSSFPCVDSEPYDKEEDPYQPTTIVHDSTDPAASATLELGPLRNIGSGSMYDGLVADEDSILVGVVMKGVALGGTGTLTVSLAAPGLTTVTSTQGFAISTNLPDNPAVSLPDVVPVGTDGTNDAYEDVMKLIDIPLVVPEEYRQQITVTVSSTAVKDIKICMIGVFVVGKNIPCLLPYMATSTDTGVELKTEWKLEVPGICHYNVSSNATDDIVTVRVGATFLKDSPSSTADLDIVVSENAVDKSTVTYTLNKASGAFTPPPFTVADMTVELNDTSETVVAPGDRVNMAIKIKIPVDAVVPLEIGVMTPSDDGRAFATVHGFTLEGGTNIGCLFDNSYYTRVLTQNSSLAVPLVHTSQTDTMIANLGVVTNHGLSYIKKRNVSDDDEIVFGAEILVADHPKAIQDYLIEISFAVKVAGQVIYVISKNLKVDKTGTLEVKLSTELFVTNLPAAGDPPFKQGDQVQLTLRVSHTNESSLEANDPKLRLLMPKYMNYTSGDSYTPNITGTPSYNKCLDITMDFLLFTDILEANLTLTVDPNSEMPKGLGLVNATTLFRVVCTTNAVPVTFKYCSSTAFALYEVNGGDCLDALQLDSLDDCCFTASSAIDDSSVPSGVKPSGTGWMPAVRSGPKIKHYLTVDFGRATRVVQLSFTEVSSTLTVKTFKIQFSHNGMLFKDACSTILEVDATGVVLLPAKCRFVARYVRIMILSVSDGMGAAAATDLSTKKIGVKFSDWQGCALDSNAALAACVTFLTTPVSTDKKKWRHAAYDASNDFVYFCDVSGKREGAMDCFCSSDGLTWNALPSYVGYLAGYDAATGRMYAMDRKDRAMIASSDCINWSIVADSLKDGILATAVAVSIPGKTSGDLSEVTVGSDWTAKFDGMFKGGTPRAKWANCCT